MHAVDIICTLCACGRSELILDASDYYAHLPQAIEAFYYARDPWGSFAEFSYDIDFIDAATEWPAADYPPEDSLNLWGPAVPDFFIANHETAARSAQQ